MDAVRWCHKCSIDACVDCTGLPSQASSGNLPYCPQGKETHMKNISRVSLIAISLLACLNMHAHQLFCFQSCGTFPGSDLSCFSQHPSLFWQCFPFNAPPPHRFFHFSFPVDAASCLGYAGALEQAAGQFNGSCLSQTAPVLTRPIWQCGSGYTELTERVTLLDLDFASPFSDLQGKSTARSASPHCLPLLTQQGLVQTDCM